MTRQRCLKVLDEVESYLSDVKGEVESEYCDWSLVKECLDDAIEDLEALRAAAFRRVM